MGYQGKGGGRDNGKSFGSVGRGGRGGSGFKGRGGRGSGRGGTRRNDYDNGSRSSYSNQSNGYYDQSKPPESAPYGQEGAPHDYQHGYDQSYYQQGPEGYEQQPQYDANGNPIYPQQQYYDYPPTQGNNCGEYPPADSNTSYTMSSTASEQGAYAHPPALEEHSGNGTIDGLPPPPPAGKDLTRPPSANGSHVGSSTGGFPPTDAQYSGQGPEAAQLHPDDAQYPLMGGDPAAEGVGADAYAAGYPLDQTQCWIDRRYHDEVARKLNTVKQNFLNTNKKYQDLKEKYKQYSETQEKKTKYLNDKIKKLLASQKSTERTSIPGPEGDGEVAVDAEKVDYKSKDDVKQSSLMNALKAERDFYKERSETLLSDIKKVNSEKSKALDSTKSVEDQLNDLRTKYAEIESEKEAIQCKLDLLNKEPPKSPILDSEGDTQITANPTEELKRVNERKEYYKNKYLKLLEEKNAEQQNFLQVNKRLLDRFIFKSDGSS